MNWKEENLKQENEEISSIFDSDENTETIFGFDNKSMIFVDDIIQNQSIQPSQHVLSDTFVSNSSHFYALPNSSQQQSQISNSISNNNSAVKSTNKDKIFVPKIPLDVHDKFHQEVIFEAEESNGLQTQETISSLNDEQIESMYLTNYNMKWNDLMGVNEQKQIIYQMIMMPLKFPQFFKKVAPTNTLLIYGPKNCGKASIVKSMVNEFKDIKILYVQCSQLFNQRNSEQSFIDPKKIFREVSKEKKVVLFLENIDELFGYKDVMGQKEMENMLESKCTSQYIYITLSSIAQKKGLFVYASSQCPWKLDPKIQKFFTKSISIKWPTKQTKINLITKKLQQLEITSLSDQQISRIAEKTKRYSCKEIERMVEQLQKESYEKSQFNIKIISHDEPESYSLFNPKQPTEEQFMNYIRNNPSQHINYDKNAFENYESLKNYQFKTQMQKKEEMLKI